MFSFQGVKDGHHVILREFSFINKIPHNRASFINLFYHSFAALGKKGGKKIVPHHSYFKSAISVKKENHPVL